MRHSLGCRRRLASLATCWAGWATPCLAPRATRIPGVLPFRVEGGIVYFNDEHILRVVLDRVGAEGKSLSLVVCDLSTSPTVDLAGARMFLELHSELAKQGIILRLVEAHASVRDLLRLEGAEDHVGRIDRFESLADVIEHFQKEGAQ